MNIEQIFYDIIKTPFGSFGIIWKQSANGARVLQTLLKTGREPVEKIIKKGFPNIVQNTCDVIKDLEMQLESYFRG